LRKAFTVREGVRPAESKLPPRAVGTPQLTDGPLKGTTVDVDSLEKDLHNLLGWDPATGGPTSETLKEMELDGLFYLVVAKKCWKNSLILIITGIKRNWYTATGAHRWLIPVFLM